MQVTSPLQVWSSLLVCALSCVGEFHPTFSAYDRMLIRPLVCPGVAGLERRIDKGNTMAMGFNDRHHRRKK
jgi:hypothetical protein